MPAWIEDRFEKNIITSTVDFVFNWARKSALWPLTFGLACCAIEMIAAASAPQYNLARFGSEVFRRIVHARGRYLLDMRGVRVLQIKEG